MSSLLKAVEEKFRKPHIVNVRSGDTVKVHQKIREGGKERIQVFEGLVIRTNRQGSHTSSITVRRIASGVGVEKTYMMHSPLVVKVEVTKRSKVRRNYLTYMRERTGKSARLASVNFDRQAVNTVPEAPEPAEEAPTAPEAAEKQQAVAEPQNTKDAKEEKEAAAEQPEEAKVEEIKK